MADNCLFCKIVSGEIPANIVYRDNEVVAFRDINPQAPVHILLVPTAHMGNVAALESDPEVGHLLTVAAELARKEGIEQGGYRLVFNVGPNAGESVPHLHLHLLGGRPLSWPPG